MNKVKEKTVFSYESSSESSESSESSDSDQSSQEESVNEEENVKKEKKLSKVGKHKVKRTVFAYLQSSSESSESEESSEYDEEAEKVRRKRIRRIKRDAKKTLVKSHMESKAQEENNVLASILWGLFKYAVAWYITYKAVELFFYFERG